VLLGTLIGIVDKLNSGNPITLGVEHNFLRLTAVCELAGITLGGLAEDSDHPLRGCPNNEIILD
jgi:hypothetical protein